MPRSDVEGQLRRALAERVPPVLQQARHHPRRRRLGLGRTGRIFGLGLSRTATTSLNAALQQLGYRSVHFPAGPASRHEVLDCLSAGSPSARLSVLDTHDAATDIPVCVMFEALDAAYPGSRFVLTVRERESWLGSCEGYWASRVAAYRAAGGYRARYIDALHDALYGSESFDRDTFADAYDRYHARVDGHFADRSRDLLRLDIVGGAGWTDLCAFLGRPTPQTAFPQTNGRP